ncbi:AF4/FMR2 family member 2 isoform X1 [Lates japonicus]|uniref:AF4/FMR2 family member 2 isoform X1 n=1 Tax=Lates japonicus TaxID=270547 RepID=A0AAD3NMC4_LATJO|nr:AF4/FMR2 family member 2 isoform X1 [Lates japonicus]
MASTSVLALLWSNPPMDSPLLFHLVAYQEMIMIQQKPTAYVRPMDGQDQAPSDSPQLKPPLVAAEGFNSSQAYGGNSGNVKNKLPKLSLSHTGEVREQPL